jgi:hypothetical protein
MIVRKESMRTQLGVAALLACCAGAAGAADWSFDPKITAGYEYDDNHRRTDVPGEEIKVSGAAVDAQVALRGDTPRTSFSLVPRLRSSFFPGDTAENTDSGYLDLSLLHKGEKSSASIDGSYSSRETLGRYFPSSGDGGGGLGDPGAGEGVGQSTNKNREDRFAFVPGVTFDLTERYAIELQAQYLDVAFDQQVQNDRQDYNDVSASAAVLYKLSPTKTLAMRASASRYEPDGSVSRNSNGLDLAWSNRMSETAEVFVRGGASRSEAGSGSTGWQTGFTGGVGVRWEYEVTNIFFDVNQYLDPNSSGHKVLRDQLRLQVSRRISPVTTVIVGARGIRDDKGRGDNTFVQRDYATGSIGFAWRMSRQFTLGGRYDYLWRKYEDQPNAAEANMLSLGITYEPHRP